MKYFAYGSNMFSALLKDRVPSAEKYAIAALKGHVLKFHKISKDGSGKCDAFETKSLEDIVYGVLFEISENGKQDLERKEGLGYGYEEKYVYVNLLDEEREIRAFTYYATNINDSLKPYHWYKDFVVSGARENNLPKDYIKLLERKESIDDPDKSRVDKNKAILKQNNYNTINFGRESN